MGTLPGENRRPGSLRPTLVGVEALPGPGETSVRRAPRVEGRGSLAQAGTLVAATLTLLNLVGYVLAVLAARALRPTAFGELNAYFGVLFVASLPGLAIQAVAARSMARRPGDDDPGARERVLVSRSAWAGAGVTVLLGALAPLVAQFLHTGVSGPLWLALQLAPYIVMSAAIGILQGLERFAAVAAIMGVQALGKVLGVIPLLTGGSPAAVLAFLTVGAAAAAVVAVLLVRPARHAPTGSLTGLPTLRETLAAGGALSALLVLANLDLLLARHLLTGHESGRYSAGAVVAKAAFWLPQAVAVVVFPRLSHPTEGRALLRQAALIVAGLGMLEAIGSALLAGPVLEFTFGHQYRSLAGLAPLWVAQGTALALVQLVVYRAIAMNEVVTSRLVAVAVAVEAVTLLVIGPTTITPVLVAATLTAVALAGTLLQRSHRR